MLHSAAANGQLQIVKELVETLDNKNPAAKGLDFYVLIFSSKKVLYFQKKIYQASISSNFSSIFPPNFYPSQSKTQNIPVKPRVI